MIKTVTTTPMIMFFVLGSRGAIIECKQKKIKLAHTKIALEFTSVLFNTTFPVRTITILIT